MKTHETEKIIILRKEYDLIIVCNRVTCFNGRKLQ